MAPGPCFLAVSMWPRMSRRFWVTSSLVKRPLIFCCAFRGRTPRSEMLLVGHMGVSEAKRGTSASRFWQNSGISLPGFCFTVVLGPGTRHRRQAERDGAAELARLAGMSRGLAVENRWLPDLERGYDGIVVGAYARHDALRLQGQSPVQDVVEAAPPRRGRLVDGNFRETFPGEQLP
jgi:hypothetical protein